MFLDIWNTFRTPERGSSLHDSQSITPAYKRVPVSRVTEEIGIDCYITRWPDSRTMTTLILSPSLTTTTTTKSLVHCSVMTHVRWKFGPTSSKAAELLHLTSAGTLKPRDRHMLAAWLQGCQWAGLSVSLYRHSRPPEDES